MPVSRHPHNGQRLLNILDVPMDLALECVEQQGAQLIITFSPESHRSVFDTSWLRENCYCLNDQWDDRSESSKRLWQRCDFETVDRIDYAAYQTETAAKVKALQAMQDDGFVVLSNVPCEPGYVLKVIETFGFIRETNYGELFDVKTVIDPNNLAFTNLGLGSHADNPYRDPVPSVQLLHCLESSASGGDSVLVDGFMAAKILREENPEHFNTLATTWINYRFSDSTSELTSRVPMIEVNDRGEVVKVRYNNRSIAPLRLPADKVQPFYAAYRHYAEVIEREALKAIFKLDAGDLVIFDNTRVMHARTAFSEGGNRHLQGAYTDLDGLYSTLAVLKRDA